MESAETLVDLNIYILDKIFSKLTLLKDQINFGSSHPVLAEVFRFNNRDRYQDINLKKLPFDMWRSFLNLCGSNVLSIKSSKHALMALYYGVKYCPALEAIDLRIKDHYCRDELIYWVGQVKTLKSIKIKQYTSGEVYEEIGTHIIESFQELKDLKKLDLDYFSPDELIFLTNLVNLKELKLAHFDKDVPIFDICSRLKRLRVLQLDGQIDDLDALADLPHHCPKLEKLSLIEVGRGLSIPYFPKLRSLVVHNMFVPVYNLLVKSVPQYVTQLERLKLFAKINQDGASLLGTLTKIKDLYICDDADFCLEYLSKLQQLETFTLDCHQQSSRPKLEILMNECKKLEQFSIGRFKMTDEMNMVNKNLCVVHYTKTTSKKNQ